MKRKLVWMAALAIAAAWLTLAACQKGTMPPTPTPKKPHVAITISKETTYITEPLRKDGYVDYVAALNRAFPRGRHAGKQRRRALPEGHGARRDCPAASRRVFQDARHPAAPGERGLLRQARQVRGAIQGREEARRSGRQGRATFYGSNRPRP